MIAPLADRWGRLASDTVGAAELLLREGRYREMREVVTSAAIATDKAQLLSGGATSRSDVRTLKVTAAAERLAELMAQLPAGR
jgi:TnpA family transposase